MKPEQIIADTGAWLALFSRKDQHHREAAFWCAAKPEQVFLVTYLIIAETLVRLRRDGIHKEKVIEAGTIFSSSKGIELQTEQGKATARVEIVSVEQADHQRALEILEKYWDNRSIDYVDCVTVAVAQRLGISHIFSFDSHFDRFPEILQRVPYSGLQLH